MLDSLASDGFGHWFSGFVDGEGSFSILPSKSARRTGSMGYYCKLGINLRDDDQDILYDIQQRLRCGTLYHGKGYGTSNSLIYWSVNSRKDCLAIVAILDQFPLRAKKRNAYNIWKQAVLIWTNPDRKRSKILSNGKSGAYDWSEIGELKIRLQEANRYSIVIRNPLTLVGV